MLKNVSIGAVVILIMVGIIADSLPSDDTVTIANPQTGTSVDQGNASFGQAKAAPNSTVKPAASRKPEGVVKILTAKEVAQRAAAGRPVLPTTFPSRTDPNFGKPMTEATPIIPPTQIGTTHLVDGEIPSDSPPH